MTVTLYQGDCLEILPTLETGSVDAIITDPPYPEIDRPYGRLTEAEWWSLMMEVCSQARRILKPTGSAVFILQANSSKVGSMRGWLWEFMAWVAREWNLIQDVYWWNYNAVPTVHTQSQNGLTRSSVKYCIWAGSPLCYRDQASVMWGAAEATLADTRESRMRRYSPSGHSKSERQSRERSKVTGQATPFNLIPLADGNQRAYHSAGTPLELAKWWMRYICPPGGVVLDPFVGSGTMMLAALEYGCQGIGIERMSEYYQIAQQRVAKAQPGLPLGLPL